MAWYEKYILGNSYHHSEEAQIRNWYENMFQIHPVHYLRLLWKTISFGTQLTAQYIVTVLNVIWYIRVMFSTNLYARNVIRLYKLYHTSEMSHTFRPFVQHMEYLLTLIYILLECNLQSETSCNHLLHNLTRTTQWMSNCIHRFSAGCNQPTNALTSKAF